MQGYGPRRTTIGLTVLAALTVGTLMGGCSLGRSSDPTAIVLPPTDRLTTESQTPSTATSAPSISVTATELPDWSFGRVIALAPRADNSRYRQGAAGPQGRLEQTEGFHFSTPDRAVSCSTVSRDRMALACRLNNSQSVPNSATRTTANCDEKANLVTLTANGAQLGACANDFPVLYRSSIVDYGTTIAVGRISCLVDPSGLYCLEAGVDSGFSATDSGFHTIYASQRAPRSLVGLEESIPDQPIPESPETTSEQSLTTTPR